MHVYMKILRRTFFAIPCTGRRIPVAREFTRPTRRGRRRRRSTKGAGALISAPGTRLVALHRPASIRTAYFRPPFYARPSAASVSAAAAAAAAAAAVAAAAAAAATATATAGTSFPWTVASNDGCSAFDTSQLCPPLLFPCFNNKSLS